MDRRTSVESTRYWSATWATEISLRTCEQYTEFTFEKEGNKDIEQVPQSASTNQDANMTYYYDLGFEWIPEGYEVGDNPDRTEQDFLKLKALSDEIYYEQDRAENTQTRKNISIQGMEEMNCCATRSLEDEWEEFEVERQNYRYAKLALGQLFTTNILTETQKRRFRLNIFYGLSSREIGRIEGASHQAVAKSLKIAVEKLRVIFAEQG